MCAEFKLIHVLVSQVFLASDSGLVCRSELWVSQCFDLFPAGHGVPHAGPAQRIHIFHDDEWSLLQSHDGQVVVLSGCCASIQFITRPHMVLHGQGTILPFTHLQGHTTSKRQSDYLKNVININNLILVLLFFFIAFPIYWPLKALYNNCHIHTLMAEAAMQGANRDSNQWPSDY